MNHVGLSPQNFACRLMTASCPALALHEAEIKQPQLNFHNRWGRRIKNRPGVSVSCAGIKEWVHAAGFSRPAQI